MRVAGTINLQKYTSVVDRARLFQESGKVTHVTGYLMKGYLPGASLGSICRVFPNATAAPFLAEVVGFRDRSVLLMPLGEMRGVGLGSRILLVEPEATLPISKELLGRVINAHGKPIDDGADIPFTDVRSIYGEKINPLHRSPIHLPVELGIRAIDGVLTVGRGQRIGIMAGSGVGKSVLLGMIAQNTDADVNVIALLGERGREVREFVERDLGDKGRKKSIVVSATSDESPLVRMRCAFVATTLAEYFCQAGANVLLMMDSITRFAMAQREIGLNTGEPPAQKGYTPSVFTLLPKLLERAGQFENSGSITGLYTVLVEGDDMDDPVADGVRSIVDGHIVLSRDLAQKGHYPAIDVLQSTSRVMKDIVSDQHAEAAFRLRQRLAYYREAEDLINIGAYKEGSNSHIDDAVGNIDSINHFLKQRMGEKSGYDETVEYLNQISQ